mgnify:FL=1
MQNTEVKPEADLKQFHKATDRHVLVLEADISEGDKRKLLHMSNIIRVAGNELIAIMKKNYEQLMRTKRYRRLRDMYVKAKKAEDKKQTSTISAEMTEMQKSYHVTWEFCRKSMIEINQKYNINSIFALSKAEDVWQAVEKCLFSDGKTINFKKHGDYPEIRAKQANRGIVISADDDGIRLKIVEIELRPIINKPKHTKTRKGNIIQVHEPHDIFAESEAEAVLNYLSNPEVIDKTALDLYNKKGIVMDTFRPCFVSISFKAIRGKTRVYIHITIEGISKPKYNKNGTRRHQYGKGFIGCDIGPQSIAYTSKEEVGLKNLAERGASIKDREQKEARILRKMDRSRRAMNPENYNDDGTIRKGEKTWKKSNRYKKLHSQYRNICRIAAENRHLAINEEVNHMRALGNVFITEPKNAKKLQKRSKNTERQGKPSVIQKSDGTEQLVYKYKRKKRHGKSIKNRCPGYFQAQAKAKFERTGGVYIEVPAAYRASQYDHTCNKYIKKALSQRMYELADGTRVQRDWYSSFLMYCIGTDLQNISRYKCKRYFDELYAEYLKLEQYIINNKITVMNSGIKFKAA